jgi:hypothetical protein
MERSGRFRSGMAASSRDQGVREQKMRKRRSKIKSRKRRIKSRIKSRIAPVFSS